MNVLSAFLSGIRTKAAVPRSLQNLEDRGWTTIWSAQDPFNFQRDIHVDHDSVLSQATVYACVSLISGDIGKLQLRLMEREKGIWREAEDKSLSPLLRKPNTYQTRQKFIECWVISKLSHGNTYVLKERENGRRTGAVRSLHVLNPDRVTPYVAEGGEVYYRLAADRLAGVPESEDTYVPAGEIIHDTAVCLFHPLVGISPLRACGLAATQALKIQQNSAIFFENMSRPSGVLTAPGFLTDDQAKEYKKRWEENYGAGKQGRTAILGNGLKYENLTQSFEDSQLVAQLELSAKQICSVFHVPGYMVQAEPVPPNNNVAMLNLQYYSQCLQVHIEGIEALLDDGLGLVQSRSAAFRTEFDLDDLLRMDTASQVDSLNKAVGGGWLAPNEARAKRNLTPIEGGDTCYLQQQYFSLQALSKRDGRDDPFTKEPATTAERSIRGGVRYKGLGDGRFSETDELAEAAEFQLAKCLREMRQ